MWDKMKALVIYGTRWGGTASIAKRIGQVLTREGYTVNIADAKKNPKTLSSYGLFIVGSGIRADKWTKETINFLQENRELLKTKKVALFVSCQMVERQDQAREKARTQYLENVAEQYGLQPVSLGYFGGFLDFHKSHGLIVDIMIRVNRNSLRKNGLDTTKVHDTRDWSYIEAWALEVATTASNKE